jgi:hypothetical protein
MAENALAKIPPKKRIPSIDELYKNIESAAEQNELNKVLNANPKPEWLRPHISAKRKYRDNKGNIVEGPALYMPIGITEYLLTAIFIRWWVEIKNISLIANSIVVTIRLHAQDPLTGDWMFQDGVGANPVHTSKGAGATEFDRILTAAVQMSAPAAESYAIKDAAEKFGRIFGSDVNRLDGMDYTSMLDSKFSNVGEDGLPEELKLVVSGAETVEDVNRIFNANKEFENIEGFSGLFEEQLRQIVSKVEIPAELGKIYKAMPEFKENTAFLKALSERKTELNTK